MFCKIESGEYSLDLNTKHPIYSKRYEQETLYFDIFATGIKPFGGESLTSVNVHGFALLYLGEQIAGEEASKEAGLSRTGIQNICGQTDKTTYAAQQYVLYNDFAFECGVIRHNIEYHN